SEVDHDSDLRNVAGREQASGPLVNGTHFIRQAPSEQLNYPAPMFFVQACVSLFLLAATATPARGFFAENAATQRKWEEQFRQLPDPAAIREYDRVLSAEPHHLGSAADEKNA